MYVITSPSDKRIAVRVSGDKQHAFSVHQQLMEYGGFPSDLEVHEEADVAPARTLSRLGRITRWLAGG